MSLNTSDRLALTDLVHLYASAVDDRRFDDVLELFTETAELRLPDPPRSLEPVRRQHGRDGVRSAMAALAGVTRTEHAIVGEVYAAGDDADYALGRITCIAHHWSIAGRSNHRSRLAPAIRRRVHADADRLADPRPRTDHQRYRDTSGSPPSSAASRRSSSGCWPFSSFDRAAATENQPTRSISGNSLTFPEPLGHSSSKVLENVPSRSRSPRTANAVMTLPLGCLTGAKSMRGPAGAFLPSSSSNSRCAAVHGSSPSVYSPLGIDQAPSSLRAQNGPPGMTDEHFEVRRRRSGTTVDPH